MNWFEVFTTRTELKYIDVQKSGAAKLTQLAHHGRILIRDLISQDYPLGLLVFILKKIIFGEIICKMFARISFETKGLTLKLKENGLAFYCKQNRGSVLPDYVAEFGTWQQEKCSSPCTKSIPSSSARSQRPGMPASVTKSMSSSLGGLKGIVETSSCDLLFKQFGKSDKSEAEFTIRNINRSSFVVCRFLPKRAIYTVTPSQTFLLPYPKEQLVKISTAKHSPIQVCILVAL